MQRDILAAFVTDQLHQSSEPPCILTKDKLLALRRILPHICVGTATVAGSLNLWSKQIPLVTSCTIAPAAIRYIFCSQTACGSTCRQLKVSTAHPFAATGGCGLHAGRPALKLRPALALAAAAATVPPSVRQLCQHEGTGSLHATDGTATGSICDRSASSQLAKAHRATAAWVCPAFSSRRSSG